MENKNEEEVVIDEIVETKDEEGNDTTDWKAIAMKRDKEARGIAQRLKTKQEKAKEKAEPEKKEEPKPEEFGLLHKSYLRAAGITAEDEIELARDIAKKWGMEIDKLVDDDDFKAKLEKLRTSKANADAVSNIKGGQGTSQAKNTPEYWIAKGTPPSMTDVPDRKTRAKIARAMMDSAKNSKKFYND